MKAKGCWYCDGTVCFDADGIGDCDCCGETYSYSEFLEREAEVKVQAERDIQTIVPNFEFD